MAHSKICKVDGCGKPYHAHGYCSRHAYHFTVHGDPLGGRFGSSPGEPLRWIAAHTDYESDGCLLWPFETNKRTGYGNVKHEGKKRLASRVMCEAAHGSPPSPEHEAAHNCGNGHLACMNQKHLRWATRTENIDDAKAHGTWQAGNVKKSKLTISDVLKIREMGGHPNQGEIATMFGVGQYTISRILSRRRWAWLD